MATRRQEVTPTSENLPAQSDSKQNQNQQTLGQRRRQRNRSDQLQTNGTKVVPQFDANKLATGLGFFSIGLGLAELLAPRSVAKLAGVEGSNTGLIRFYGMREIASGVGIFSQKKPVESLWARVAGDAIDLATLGAAFASPNTKKGRLAFATASVLGVTALDVACAQALQTNGTRSTTVNVQRTVIVNRPVEELYRFWRNLENLPKFMKHLEAVHDMGDGRSHWIAKAPADTRVEWHAQIVEDVPNELIAWESLEGSDVENAGFVIFETAQGDRGTVVSVEFEYEPPAGLLGVAIAKLFGEEPEQQVAADLRRFKQLMETGEVVISDATLLGTGYMEQLPARPAEDSERQKAWFNKGNESSKGVER